MYFMIPETMGLTCAEKKQLFYPGAKFGRKLRPGETFLLDTKEEFAPSGIADTFITDSSTKVPTQ